MQNRGALKFLVIVLLIACAYQLSFTVVTRRVEKKAANYAAQFPAEQQVEKEQAYLDSVKTLPVYNLGFIKFSYKDSKEKELNLGLDLKGGMNVMLEISVEDVLKVLSNDSKDPAFNQALTQAKEQQKNSNDDFITLFSRAYNQISGGAPLATIFNTPELRSEITPTSSNDEVVRVLRRQVDDAIESSFNVLRSRIDRFGVTQPNVQRIESTGRILVELPGVKEPERVRKLLQGTASLEFWATYSNPEIFTALQQANTVIRDIEEANNSEAVQNTADSVAGNIAEAAPAADSLPADSSSANALLDEIGGDQTADTLNADYARQFPLYAKLQPMADPQTGQAYPGPVVGHVMSYDTAAVNSMLNLPQVRALLPRDAKLMWGVKGIVDRTTQQETNVFELYAIKANTRDGNAPLDGSAVVEARSDLARDGSSEVSMTMNTDGANKWARLTADNINRSIAIVLDGYVYSAPTVNQEITGGSSQITGQFTPNEATDLANVLKSGKLPAPARITQETIVGPSLGQESIDASMISFILAFILVLIYMIIFYSTAGAVANIAMLCNLFFQFGVLVSFGAVLTLPGIAGIVLTMSLSVDANVLIYERTKEELRAGKGLSAALVAGYKHAMSAIVDTNITTLITGIVLFYFGTGPVQGFATTLIIGIITSFFCAIFVSRLIFTAMLKKEMNIKFSHRFSENFLGNTKYNFIKHRKKAYAVSLALVLISVASLAIRGMNMGVDFTGGRTFVVRFDRDITANEVRERIFDVFQNAEGDDENKSFEVKQFGSDNQMRIVTQYRADDESDSASDQVEALIYEAVNPLFEKSLTLDEFTTTTTGAGIVSADKVGATIANEIIYKSIIAVIFSVIAIGIYIIVRFKRWQWGAGSVVALAQDGFLTIGLFSVFHGILPFAMEVDQSFIAAVLTIIGYSINDKVVIFDRIREYGKLYPKRDMKENINNAINSTLARTINTSVTTFVTLLAIFLFGGEVIRGFIFALLFGVVIGTVSSFFTATPFAYDLMVRSDKKKKAKQAGA